jgi:hypothetical protein
MQVCVNVLVEEGNNGNDGYTDESAPLAFQATTNMRAYHWALFSLGLSKPSI